MDTKKIRTIVYSVVGALIVILIGVVSYLYLSGRQSSNIQQTTRINIGGISALEANKPLNVDVLNDSAYKALDRSIMDANKIPVKAPENRGKANLFGI